MTYTDKQLLDQVACFGAEIVPNKYLGISVQNSKDTFNKFDDKFYLFLGGEFVLATTITTNPGKNALLNFDKSGNKAGAAVWLTDTIYKDLYSYGLHRGKMPCLRQVAPIKYFRDNDKDQKAEQEGELHEGIIYANFHGVDYNPESEIIKTDINGWSYGCQVCNNMTDYREIIQRVKANPYKMDYALLSEF